ncbi:hypothetical protein BKA60DRAFT_528965 [Fusarium oxysporum]|nr:hypothetical protein BKA60DRAFT_528965 [Fusarium oxysporum]
MARITKQLNGPFHLKWVRKHFYQGSTTSPHMEVGSQKCPCQCFGHKVVRSIRFNRSSPGTVDDQVKPETSHEEAYQYHQPSDKIWVNPMPEPKETNESNNSHLSNKLHHAFLFPAKPHLLEPPSTPPPEKPLPEIPTQSRPHKTLDRVGRKEQDSRPPGRSSPNTAQEAMANYSPFPKRAPITRPRSSSYQRIHKPQGLTCANATVTKHHPRHVAELYQDPSIEREPCIDQATLPKSLGD